MLSNALDAGALGPGPFGVGPARAHSEHEQSMEACQRDAKTSGRQAKVAVILNGNARAVTPGMIRTLKRHLRDETIFISSSPEQSRFVARQIVNRRFDVVLCGGGDGTLTRCVTDIMALRPRPAPAFGVLRLGTGNAVADALGAKGGLKGVLRDVRLAHDPDTRVRLPLLRVEGLLAPFAGVGLDAMILEDYCAVRRDLQNTPLRALVGAHAGYSLAIATRSIWRYLLEKRPEVTIRNEGAPARPIDLRGVPVGPALRRGEILYRGPVTLAAASTVPFYGLGARIFPQACLREDRFQLRVGNVPLRTMLARLPQVISGEFSHEDVWDYTCSAISIEIAAPTPLQIGGDLAGPRTRVFISMTTVEGVVGCLGPESTPAPAPDLPLSVAQHG